MREFKIKLSRGTGSIDKLSTPQAAADFFAKRIGDEAVEVFMVVGLSASGEAIGCVEVARGGYATCTVDPRVLFSSLLAMGPVSSFIVSHNHPSGDPSPSVEDVRMTRQLKDAGNILCLRLVDHVIVTGKASRSMMSAGLIDAPGAAVGGAA